jgi:signal transduction histidine kinase
MLWKGPFAASGAMHYAIGGNMKRMWLVVLLVFVGLAFVCPPAECQPRAGGRQSPVDLLIKSEVETAVSMLQAIFAKHQRGEMTLEQAKKLGADLLRELQYGKDGYFWADTTDGVNVVLYGRKDVEGRNRLEDKDSKGAFYVKAFLEKGKAGGGYVEYLFPKKGETEALPKRSYVQAFTPFGWVIGTGYYLPVRQKATGEQGAQQQNAPAPPKP